MTSACASNEWAGAICRSRGSVREWLVTRDEFLAAVADQEVTNPECFKIDVPPRPVRGYARRGAFRSDFVDDNRLGFQYGGAMNDLFIGQPFI